MQTRPCRTLELTELGLGGSQLGNLYREVDDATATAVFEAAWEAGIRYLDTAPHYGLGLSERRLGRLLAGIPRDQYVLSSKVGRLLEPNPDPHPGLDAEGFAVPATTLRRWDFSRDGVRRSVEESLERLGVDHLDIAYLHDPDDHWEQALAAGLPALQELRDEGVVTAIGAGMNAAAPLLELVREHDVDVVMCAGRHTLLEQAWDLLDAAAAADVAVVVAGVYNSGLLARPRPVADTHYDYAAPPREVLERAHALADRCEAHGLTLPEAALAFPLSHPAVRSVVVGASRPAHVHAAVAALDRVRSDGEGDRLWAELGVAAPTSHASTHASTHV
ncbi:aldo/keto reductase [Nocardioides fonticola]|uniref:Aldo/keto reductase n=1 Tax=Nocardioides fonticola TaxID=450363 RepID=A0ABP7XGU2_9ACTN